MAISPQQKFVQNDTGVAHVVGTILMIAVTIAIAAIVVAFVSHLVYNVPHNKFVGVDVRRIHVQNTGPGSGIIVVRNLGGGDYQYLKQGSSTVDCFRVMVNGQPATTVKYPAAAATISYAGPTISSYQYFQVDPGADVTVVAAFTDNSEYVIWSGVVN
ncbi:MAG TPA: type IV pilin [Methanocella sp.]|nr:type IV pilin [Methanocella sp.]